MKTIGRLVVSDHEMSSLRPGTRLVIMTNEEWEMWRALTGASVDGEHVLTPDHVEAVVQLRFAMEEAAKAMGKKLVPIGDEAPKA